MNKNSCEILQPVTALTQKIDMKEEDVVLEELLGGRSIELCSEKS